MRICIIGDMKKKDGRSLCHATLEAFRFAAVKLHKSGVAVANIAESFRVTDVAVYIWLKRMRTHGIKSLKSSKALGPEPKLSEQQFQELLRLLRRPATELRYSTDLWSGPRIRHLIKTRFGETYHAKHMPRLLRRLGLVIKFPERRALEQDPKALRKWKRTRFPEILADVKKRRALLFYADESLISLIPYVGKTWTFPKCNPIVRVSGKRGKHIGVTAAITRQGRMCFELTRDEERFTAKVFLRFLRKMRRENPSRPIVLIVDGAPIHKAKIVKAFDKKARWLRLEILPAYSPELNPTEKVWGFVKTKKLNGSTAMDKKQLREKAQKALADIKKKPDRITTFFLSKN